MGPFLALEADCSFHQFGELFFRHCSARPARRENTVEHFVAVHIARRHSEHFLAPFIKRRLSPPRHAAGKRAFIDQLLQALTRHVRGLSCQTYITETICAGMRAIIVSSGLNTAIHGTCDIDPHSSYASIFVTRGPTRQPLSSPPP